MSERDQPKPEDMEALKDPPVQPDLAMLPHAAPIGADVPLEPELQAFIGRQLQATYDEVLNEAVPDRFLDLLRQLEGDAVPPGASQSANASADKADKQ
jgi:hypothetical protein